MTALRRQQLVRLSGEGWARVLDAPWDAEARSCLGLWAARGLPLVVTRAIAGTRITRISASGSAWHASAIRPDVMKPPDKAWS